MAIATKTVEHIFFSNLIFLLPKKTRMIFHLLMTLVIKNNIWKYLMANVMGFPYLDMANSAFSSAQAKDI